MCLPAPPRFPRRLAPRATSWSGNYHNPGPSLWGEQGSPTTREHSTDLPTDLPRVLLDQGWGGVRPCCVRACNCTSTASGLGSLGTHRGRRCTPASRCLASCASRRNGRDRAAGTALAAHALAPAPVLRALELARLSYGADRQMRIWMVSSPLLVLLLPAWSSVHTVGGTKTTTNILVVSPPTY